LPQNSCTVSECPFSVAYESGDRSSLSFKFTSTPPRVKNSCTISECPFLGAYKKGDQRLSSFEFTSTSLRPQNSRATS
jgi:hypothetical protein